jgi:hypothetical protein
MCQHFAQLQEVERAAKAAHKIPMSSAGYFIICELLVGSDVTPNDLKASYLC